MMMMGSQDLSKKDLEMQKCDWEGSFSPPVLPPWSAWNYIIDEKYETFCRRHLKSINIWLPVTVDVCVPCLSLIKTKITTQCNVIYYKFLASVKLIPTLLYIAEKLTVTASGNKNLSNIPNLGFIVIWNENYFFLGTVCLVQHLWLHGVTYNTTTLRCQFCKWVEISGLRKSIRYILHISLPPWFY